MTTLDICSNEQLHEMLQIAEHRMAVTRRKYLSELKREDATQEELKQCMHAYIDCCNVYSDYRKAYKQYFARVTL